MDNGIPPPRFDLPVSTPDAGSSYEPTTYTFLHKLPDRPDIITANVLKLTEATQDP